MDYLGFGNNVFSLPKRRTCTTNKTLEELVGLFRNILKMRESVSVACAFILCMNLRRALFLTYNAFL